MAAALDWEFASVRSSLFDLSILLRYAGTLPPEFEQEGTDGYSGAGGRISYEWKRVIKLLGLLSLCEFLCSQCPHAAMITDVTQLIRATVEGWDSYFLPIKPLTG